MKIGCVVMASGMSKRFGANKLLAEFCGDTLIGYALKRLPLDCFARVLVLTRTPEVRQICAGLHLECLLHELPERSAALRLGVERMRDMDGCLFRVADQPLCSEGSIRRMCARFEQRPSHILRLAWQGEPGNPVLFPAWCFEELASLTGSQGGGAVAKRHPDRLETVEAETEAEMWDADVPERLLELERAREAAQ